MTPPISAAWDSTQGSASPAARRAPISAITGESTDIASATITASNEISARTLADMDEAVGNLREGRVSEPIDISDIPPSQEGS